MKALFPKRKGAFLSYKSDQLLGEQGALPGGLESFNLHSAGWPVISQRGDHIAGLHRDQNSSLEDLAVWCEQAKQRP
jgi:hypothetical protein